jgi:hypothetical protein
MAQPINSPGKTADSSGRPLQEVLIAQPAVLIGQIPHIVAPRYKMTSPAHPVCYGWVKAVRASLEVADFFRAAGPAYRAIHGGHLSLHQLKVMSAIEHYSAAALDCHVGACEDCGHWRIA